MMCASAWFAEICHEILWRKIRLALFWLNIFATRGAGSVNSTAGIGSAVSVFSGDS